MTLSDEADGDMDGPFDAWLVLYVPDGKDPTAIPLDGGPWESRTTATLLIDTIYTAIGEKFAPTGRKEAKRLERYKT